MYSIPPQGDNQPNLEGGSSYRTNDTFPSTNKWPPFIGHNKLVTSLLVIIN